MIELSGLVGRIKSAPRVRVPRALSRSRVAPSQVRCAPKIVQERLGHSTIAITMDLYSPLIDGMETTAAERS